MALSREEILKKVKDIEDEQSYLRRCLLVNICPACGGKLNVEKYDDGMSGIYGKVYDCPECGFKKTT
jgi:hypothetical protein